MAQHPPRRRSRASLSVEVLEARNLFSASGLSGTAFNAPPVLSVPGTTFSIVKTAALSIPLSATDANSGGTLTFALQGAPDGAVVSSTQVTTASGSAATGLLTWTPTEDQGPASYSFTVAVTYNGIPTATTAQQITVNTLAVGFVGNDLWIVGTSTNQGTSTNPGNDVAAVSATGDPSTVNVSLNGASGSYTIPAGGQIVTKLFGGDDTFTINEPVGQALNYDGGSGNNTLTVNGTAVADSFTITGSSVSLAGAGTVTYANVQKLFVDGLGGGDTFLMTGISAATMLDGGGTGSFTGLFPADFNGTLTLTNMLAATLTIPETLTAGSSITGTNFSNVTLGTLAGTLLAGGGSINGAMIGTVAKTGLLKVTETSGGSAGMLNDATIGIVAGTVLAGAINHPHIGTILSGGLVMAAGQGTTDDVSIGTVGGSFIAPEDSNAGSGVMTDTSIDSMTSTGVVSTGSISGMTVGTADSGSSIIAGGQGTTDDVSIGTLDGSFISPEDSNAGSGVMSNTTIDSIGSTGVVSTGSISGMTVGTADSGSSITAGGQGTTDDVSIGTLGGSFISPEDSNAGSGTMTNTSIDSLTSTGVVSTGSISGMTVGTADSGSSITAAGAGTITGLTIGTLAGTVTAKPDSTPGSGTLSNATIDTLTPTGVINAFTTSSLTMKTVSGTLSVSGLSTFAVDTLTGTANLTAGHFSQVMAKHVSATVNFIEPTVTRTVTMTPHVPGGATEDYSLVYDGTVPGNPRVVIAINAASPGNFDVGVATSVPSSGIDLAGIYSLGGSPTGIHNLVLDGNLLVGAISKAASNYLGLPTGTTGGVQLPLDSVAVALAGTLPMGSIVAKSVLAVAASSFGGVPADSATASAALAALAAGTGLAQANDTFQVYVTAAAHVAQFLVTVPGGSFDSRVMLFADIGNPGAPVLVSETLGLVGSSTNVLTVTFTGQGASLSTAQPILTSITALPGGSIGNLTLSAPSGITANVTADRILGNIMAPAGGLSGTIETTVGDLGSALTNASGQITGVTSVTISGGGLTGKLLVKGNLVSQVNLISVVNTHSGLDGVIAVDGDIGVPQAVGGVAQINPDGSLIRFGGISITSGANGQIVARGNVFGDIYISGTVNGRLAVNGNPGEYGLPAFRYGFLGNLTIRGSLGATGAIVTTGLLGDDGTDNIFQDALGTHLSYSGADAGILAAGEDINLGTVKSINMSGFFENATGTNLAAINAIFTNGGMVLDVLDPTQLNLILQDLLALKVGGGMLTGTTA
jgi:hypothetical protein